LSVPLVASFGDLLVPFHLSPSATYMVDISTIIAFVVYSIGFAIIRGILRLLTKKQR
jgi:hypothetical protein